MRQLHNSKDFFIGVALSASHVAGHHDQPALAYELLREAGLNDNDLLGDLGLSEWDYVQLEKAMAHKK